MKRTIGAALIYPLFFTLGCSTNGGGGDGPPPGSGSTSGVNNGGTGSNSTSSNAGQQQFGFGTGGSGASSTKPLDMDAGCAAQQTDAQLTRVNILFLLDKSGSMGDYPDSGWTNAATRWNPVVTTLDSFFSDQKSTGIYASLSFLPADGYEGSICKSSNYSTGTSAIKVPLTLLDATGRQMFLSRLCDPAAATASTCIKPAGGTPTRPALQGTIDYLLTVQQKYPDSKTVIVFLTDGEPGFGFEYNGQILGLNSCDDLPPLSNNHTASCAVGTCGGCVDDSTLCTPPDVEVQKVANVIKTAPSKSIYLFGVGDLSASTMDVWSAATGNPAVALQGMSGTQAAATLKAALESIRTTHIDCNIKIPPPKAGNALDITKVNVNYVDGSGKSTPLGKSQGCTSPQNSWEYDDPATPTYIKLCANACNMAQQDAAGKIQVVLGCATYIL